MIVGLIRFDCLFLQGLWGIYFCYGLFVFVLLIFCFLGVLFEMGLSL